MAQTPAEILRDGLVHTQYTLKYYYPKMFQGTAAQREAAKRVMWQAINNALGSMIQLTKNQLMNQPQAQTQNQQQQQQQQQSKTSAQVEWLIKMAEEADSREEYELADMLDNIAQSLNRDAGHVDVLEKLAEIADQLDMTGRKDLADKMDDILQRSNDNVSAINDLIEMANILDDDDQPELASSIDHIASLISTASDYSFLKNIKVAEDGEDIEPPPIESRSKGHLSSRYCPDHRGVQAARVAEGTYQCPIDGKVYNYQSGYKNYKGQLIPGGSVAEQTPTTSNYGIPMRFYDSRQSILNTMH